MSESEEIFFFPGSGGRRLLGVLHMPGLSGPPAESRPGMAEAAPTLEGAGPSLGMDGPPLGVVFCHPFGEEKMMGHTIAVRTARGLRDLGLPVLRFDFSGCGDSEGELDEVTLDDWLEDIGCAVAELARRMGGGRIALWGSRLGATLALQYAAGRVPGVAADPVVPFLLLWQPLPDLEQYIKQFLRQKLSTEIASGQVSGSTGRSGKENTLSVKSLQSELEAGHSLEVTGYPISPRLYKSFLARAKSPSPAATPPLPILVAAASLSESMPPAPKRVADALLAEGHAVELVQAKEETFWDRYWRWDAPLLTEATVAYAKARLSAPGAPSAAPEAPRAAAGTPMEPPTSKAGA